MSLQKMFENVRQWNRHYDIIIAVEGLYPERRRQALISTWAEYEALLHAEYPLCNRLVTPTHRCNTERKRPLQTLSETCCVHNTAEKSISANNGRVDAHQPWSESNSEWWWEVVDARHDECVVFCERIFRRVGII